MPRVRELPRFSNPGHCIMFPGRRRDDRGFYMFDTVIDGPGGDIHIGISGEGLRTIADRHGEQFGIVKREKYDDVLNLALGLKSKVLGLEAQVAELQEFKEHIAGVAAGGFDVKRRQGRPPTKKED
jgi:hypothetical protein